MTSSAMKDKPFKIDKRRVYKAYKAVKSNQGAAGVDGQTLKQFETDWKRNLYRIWNRMSSGSYFPPPVSSNVRSDRSSRSRSASLFLICHHLISALLSGGTTSAGCSFDVQISP